MTKAAAAGEGRSREQREGGAKRGHADPHNQQRCRIISTEATKGFFSLKKKMDFCNFLKFYFLRV